MKKIIALVVASFVSFALHAQSADKISEIISAKEASYGQAAYLAGCARGTVKVDSAYEEALAVLKENGVVSSSVKASDSITMKELSWICSYGWKVEGSLMMKFFNSPRYTFRQMKADEVIGISVDPMNVPNGRELLAVITDCISKYQVKEGEDK
nr:hypothetical protein [uncultured Treponema sp.]